MLRIDWLFVARLGIGILGVFLLGLAFPPLVYEDGLIESASALWFAAAALFGLVILVTARGLRPGGDRLLLAGVTALALLCFLSEISFGARLFHVAMRAMPGGGEFDGGQDILILCIRLLQQASLQVLVLALLGLALAASIAAACAYRYRRMVRAICLRVLASKVLFRLALAVLMLGVAVMLDLIPSFKASVLEETLEFFSGPSLIAAIHPLWRRGRSRTPALSGSTPAAPAA